MRPIWIPRIGSGAKIRSNTVPITVVGTGTPVKSIQLNYDVPLPGTASGTYTTDDLLLMVVQNSNNPSVGSANSFIYGYKGVPKNPQFTGTANSAGSTRMTAYWKFATSGAETTPTWNDQGDHQIAQMFALRGVDKTAPFDCWAGGSNASTANHTIPGVTTRSSNILSLMMMSHAISSISGQLSSSSNSNLTTLLEVADSSSADGNGGGFTVLAGTMVAAGATGNTSVSLAAASVMSYIHLGLRPIGSPSLSGSSPGSGTLAAEDVEFTLNAPTTIRYGSATQYFSDLFPVGVYTGGNSLFDGGDPHPFTTKTVYIP